MSQFNQPTILFPYDPAEFWNQMRKLIQEEMGKQGSSSSHLLIEEPLLKRQEIAKRLNISLVTLNDWMKRGLPCHKQRGRVYFLFSEVLPYIKENRKCAPFPPVD